MKANELMIGDWVRNALLNEVFKMNTTSMRNMCWDEDYGTARYTIEPIPLTAEILEKNGFVYESDGLTYHDGIHNEEQLYIYCPIRRNGNVRKIEICSIRRHYFAELENEYYVHELQHALRLCGLNELAENFKV